MSGFKIVVYVKIRRSRVMPTSPDFVLDKRKKRELDTWTDELPFIGRQIDVREPS